MEDEELLESMLNNDTHISMPPVKEYKVKIRIKNMKVIHTTWSSGMSWTIGIVVTENEVGKRKIRCGTVPGINEEADSDYLAAWGSTLSPADLQTMIDLVKEGK